MVILRDGRKLQGVFRSYDQYGELRPMIDVAMS
jgi:small nuclear ribonucleoprotein (snRNP)-like protein